MGRMLDFSLLPTSSSLTLTPSMESYKDCMEILVTLTLMLQVAARGPQDGWCEDRDVRTTSEAERRGIYWPCAKHFEMALHIRFLNLGITDILGKITFWCLCVLLVCVCMCVCQGRDCHVYRRVFTSIPSLYPLDVSITLAYCDNQNCKHWQMSHWDQNNSWLRATTL